MQDAGERVGFEQVYDGVRVYPRADAHHFGVEGVDTSDDLRVFKAMLYEDSWTTPTGATGRPVSFTSPLGTPGGPPEKASRWAV